MVVAPLSERAATALLGYSADVSITPLPPERHFGDFLHRVMGVDTGVGGQTNTNPTKALQWRRAMETMNALACCRGLGVQENPRFWRPVFAPMGTSHYGKRSQLSAFDDDLLSRYRVQVPVEANTERVAAALAACFSADPESQAQRVREEIHAKLRSHFVRAAPPLELELELGEGPSARRTWELARHTLWDLNRLWRVETASAFQEQVAVVLNVPSPSSDTDQSLPELCSVLSLPSVVVCELRIHGAMSPTEISVLMRELVRLDTVETMSLSLLGQDPRCVAAVCSALPVMRSLRTLLVNSQKTEGEETKAHQDAFYMWLAYALTERKARALSLALVLEIREGARATFEGALVSPSCLVKLIPSAVEAAVFVAHGASAVVRANASLTTEPHLPSHFGNEPTSFDVSKERRVTVIAQSGSKAVIVWPGIGLLWAPLGDLSDWRTFLSPVMRGEPVLRIPLVEKLCCEGSASEAVVDFLRATGGRISHLTLSFCSRVSDDLLTAILSSCPRLKALAALYTEIDSVSPLIKRYVTGNCEISTLSFDPSSTRGDTEATIPELFDCLADPNHPAAKTLRILSLQDAILLRSDIVDIVAAVERNRTLQVVEMTIRRADDEWEDDYAYYDFGDDLLGHLSEQPVVQTDRSKRAMYTFLLAARRLPVLRLIPLPCVTLVAQYAATPALRRVAWHEV